MKSYKFFCVLLLSVSTTLAKSLPKQLVGAWYLIDLDKPLGGTEPQFLPYNVNYVLLSFIDPSNMTFTQDFKDKVHWIRSSNPKATIMVSLGGESFASKWSWLSDKAQSIAAAKTVASWAQFGIDGIDIDIEDGGLSNPPENMVAFMQTIRQEQPGLLITLCVYGNPEGRDFDNYLINNHLLKEPKLIDLIHIMAYNGYDNDVTYIENYTNAPRSKWDHPIDGPVANDTILIAMKGPAGLASCDPTDYQEMIAYNKQNNIRGIGVWDVTNINSTVPQPWFSPDCLKGFETLCNAFSATSQCGRFIST